MTRYRYIKRVLLLLLYFNISNHKVIQLFHNFDHHLMFVPDSSLHNIEDIIDRLKLKAMFFEVA